MMRVITTFEPIEASLYAFDTVTLLKCPGCKQMRELVGSCYINVTGVT